MQPAGSEAIFRDEYQFRNSSVGLAPGVESQVCLASRFQFPSFLLIAHLALTGVVRPRSSRFRLNLLQIDASYNLKGRQDLGDLARSFGLIGARARFGTFCCIRISFCSSLFFEFFRHFVYAGIILSQIFRRRAGRSEQLV